MLIRERYLQEVRPLYHIDLIKVLVGLRRCGKSCLLMQIKDELLKEAIQEDHIIYMNFEYVDYADITDFRKLNTYIENFIKDKDKYYIMLDEIQNVSGFERTINSLRAKYQCSIFITGSNSNLLSKELATLLTGRYMEFSIYPFSFLEMLEYKKIDKDKAYNQVYLNEYLKWGGLPQRFELQNEMSCFNYLQDVFHSVLFKDIMARYDFNNRSILEKVIQYIFDNIGNLFSANTIVKQFRKENIVITIQEVFNCLQYLQDAMLIEKVSRYDIKGKKILEFYEKFYATDLGIANIFKQTVNMGGLLENLVYNELISSGYQVYIGKTYRGEVDFIAQKGSEKCYIQVCLQLNQTVLDEHKKTTYDREFEAFSPIKDSYPKFVISTDPFDMSKDGIQHLNLTTFLLEGLPL